MQRNAVTGPLFPRLRHTGYIYLLPKQPSILLMPCALPQTLPCVLGMALALASGLFPVHVQWRTGQGGGVSSGLMASVPVSGLNE
jgi:hypothetical protein